MITLRNVGHRTCVDRSAKRDLCRSDDRKRQQRRQRRVRDKRLPYIRWAFGHVRSIVDSSALTAHGPVIKGIENRAVVPSLALCDSDGHTGRDWLRQGVC